MNTQEIISAINETKQFILANNEDIKKLQTIISVERQYGGDWDKIAENEALLEEYLQANRENREDITAWEKQLLQLQQGKAA